MARLALSVAEQAIVHGSFAAVGPLIPWQTLLKTLQLNAQPPQGAEPARDSQGEEIMAPWQGGSE